MPVDGMDPEELKFAKSASNRRTEGRGVELLLEDERFQVLDLSTKRRLLELLGLTGEYGPQSFDAVMTPIPVGPITFATIEHHLTGLRLVEMKSTRKPIRDRLLNGFFFGATEREYNLARELGDTFVFAFCVLNDVNAYGRPFFVLLTLAQLEERTRSKRVQFQVNLRSDLTRDEADDAGLGPKPEFGIGVAAERPPPYGSP